MVIKSNKLSAKAKHGVIQQEIAERITKYSQVSYVTKVLDVYNKSYFWAYKRLHMEEEDVRSNQHCYV